MPATLDPPLGPEDHVLGPADAPLELVMYGDFECPYCVASQSMVRRARERLDGRLRFGFRHYPLPRHPQAQKSAEASEAALAQDAFWPMFDRLYASRGRLSIDDMVGYAAELGLDAERLRADLDGDVHAPRVARDEASAHAAGIPGTPAFFVNGTLHEGSFDAGSLVEALEAGAAAA